MTWFRIVAALWVFLPPALSIAIVLFHRPRNALFRAGAAVLVGWVFLVLFTMLVYSPAGIAAGHEQGLDFPENHYDNNVSGPAIVVGWIYPLVAVMVALAVQRMVSWLRARRGGGA
jgi:hypothetical protein